MGVYKNETPTVPVFLYHASQDEIVPYANASTWCTNGASVKFTTFASGGHITTEVIALLDSLEFAKMAFASMITNSCSRNTKLGSSLDPLALGLELEPVLSRLAQILLTAGEEDINILNDIQTLGKTVQSNLIS
ncbi:hypothetical protein B7463_g9779, partial [Scytalidium lignicola]